MLVGPCTVGGGLHWTANLDTIRMLNIINGADLGRLALGYHLMLEVPAGTSCELRYDNVAITKEVDVEVDVVDRLCSG